MRRADKPYHFRVLSFLKSGSLNLLETSGPVQACNGIALPLTVYSFEVSQPFFPSSPMQNSSCTPEDHRPQYPEDGGTTICRKIRNCSPNDKTSLPKIYSIFIKIATRFRRSSFSHDRGDGGTTICRKIRNCSPNDKTPLPKIYSIFIKIATRFRRSSFSPDTGLAVLTLAHVALITLRWGEGRGRGGGGWISIGFESLRSPCI